MARPNGRASHPDARRVELSGCRGEEIGQACGRVDRSEAGAGRFTGFVLPPLTFAEYLRFAQQEDALIRDGEASITSAPQYLTNDIDALNTGFINYLDYGGLPEAVTNPVFSASPARLLRQDIVDKVLLEDLPSLCGIGDTQELNRFFNVLAFNTGNEVSLEALSQHSAITKAKPNDHLEHVEAALLVRRVHRIDDDALRLQGARTLKVHLTNPSIRAALFGMVSAEGFTTPAGKQDDRISRSTSCRSMPAICRADSWALVGAEATSGAHGIVLNLMQRDVATSLTATRKRQQVADTYRPSKRTQVQAFFVHDGVDSSQLDVRIRALRSGARHDF